MQIDNTGFIKATLTNYLEYMTADIQSSGTFGSDFTIKKEGVIDAILSTTSNAMISLEDKIAFALKQLNPYTAEGEWQDKLYALVGLIRRYATNTVVTRTIEGEVGTNIDANELVFKTAQDDEFFLNTPITIGENGKAIGSFTAYQSGSIECPNDSILTIISAPLGVDGVYYESGNLTDVGDDYEDDSEFRLRWIATNSVNATSKTEGGLRTALLDLVSTPTDLKIRQNRGTYTFEDMPLHSLNIILKSAYSNDDIAKKILAYLTDGVGLVGVGVSGVEDVTVTLKDSEGTDTDITFTRAQATQISFDISVHVKDGYTLETDKIKSAIVDNFNYVLGEKIVANDFYQYLNAIESIDYVDTLEISLDGVTYANILNLQYYQYGTVDKDDITVTEAI